MSVEKVLEAIKANDVQFVDLRFVDTKGKEQHVSVRSTMVDADFFVEGKMFDGSSIDGWKGINKLDMILMPDPDSMVMDPFYEDPTLILRCDVIEPDTMMGYTRDPRSIVCVGQLILVVLLSKLVVKKLLGVRIKNTSQAILGIVLVLKEGIFLCRRLILVKTYVLRCA